MDAIELVLEDLVRIAIMQLVFFYTDNNLNDKEIFHYYTIKNPAPIMVRSSCCKDLKKEGA